MIATSSADEVDKEQIVEEELQAYIDHGAMTQGEFPINSNVTL